MKLITASRPYAKALYQISTENSEKKTSESWLSIMQICAELGKNKSANKMLNDHYVGYDFLNDFISKLFKKSNVNEVPSSFDNFIKLLVHKKRVSLLPTISELFIKSYNDDNNILDTKIISAKEISASEQELLLSCLGSHFNKTIKPTIEIDPTLIGGVVIEINGTIIDGSIKGRLEQLIKTLV